MARHAEIAGGGIGGLGLAMMLARRGWSVRVHERAPEIREIGAGISLRNNCIEVLEGYGVFDELRQHGTLLTGERHFDRNGTFVQERSLLGNHRTLVVPRQGLVDILARSARDAGVEIATASPIVGADAVGALIGEGGTRFPADLCLGTDGVGSKVRQSLDFGAIRGSRPTCVNRFLVGPTPFTDPTGMREYWSGDRRIGIMPSGVGRTFVYAVVPASDKQGAAMPMDVADWSRAYPVLAPLFQTIASSSGSQFTYPLVRCARWSSGKVVLLGDAAHAMPPTLGQGASLTLMNAHALAVTLDRQRDVARALGEWEKRVRFLTDATQKWAVMYDRFTSRWPSAFRPLRPSVIRAFARVGFLNERMRVADRGLQLIGFAFEPAGA